MRHPDQKHVTVDVEYKCTFCPKRQVFPIVPYMPAGSAECSYCGGQMRRTDR